MLRVSFRRFIFSDPSKLVLDKLLNARDEAYTMTATTIQMAFRCHRSRRIVAPKLAAMRAENARMQQEIEEKEKRVSQALNEKYGRRPPSR
jgi:hypothetical protein